MAVMRHPEIAWIATSRGAKNVAIRKAILRDNGLFVYGYGITLKGRWTKIPRWWRCYTDRIYLSYLEAHNGVILCRITPTVRP